MALPPAEQILWGTGFENIVDFDYPRALDTPRAWRRPAPGSARARNSAGVTDAAVYGYDYLLAGRARWFGRSDWDNPVGLQAFLDWAGQGNPFRFVPDKTVPDFYVDNCVLDTPFDEVEPSLEEADGSQSIDVVIRNPTVSFGQALRGIMFEYAPGMSLTDPVAATFTRATAATRRGLPGTLVSPVGASDASGVLRDRHYEGALRTTLLEAARTQLVTDPENFGNWSITGTPIRTAGQADPFGGTGAYLVEDDDAGVAERVLQTVGFTADAGKAVACFFRAGTIAGANDVIGLWDNTAAVWRHKVVITWTNGVPTLSTGVGGGTLFPVESWGAGWYRLAFSATGVVAANTNQIFIGNDAVGTVGTHYIFGANAWNAVFPSSYQGPSLTTKNADSFSWAYGHKPQALFWYAKTVDRGTAQTVNARILEIGTSAGTAPTLILYRSSVSEYTVYHHNGAASVLIAHNPTIAFGDTVEFLLILQPDGKVKVLVSVNGGAAQDSGLSAANALAAAWATGAGVWLNSEGASNVGFSAFAQMKVGPLTFGGRTIDTIAKAQAV
jgi:hypothetical protein